MTRRMIIPAWATIVFATLISTCCARTWTNRNGRQVEADLVSFKDGIVKIKRSSDGKVFDLPLKLLSEQDQTFVKTAPKDANSYPKKEIKKEDQPDLEELKQKPGAPDALGELKKAGAVVNVDEKSGAITITFFLKDAITSEQMEQLRSVEKLESLFVGFIEMSDEHLRLLGPIKGIKSLTITGREITDDGLRTLTKFPELKSLRLAWTKISDDGLKHIAKMNKLDTLSFSPLLVDIFADRGAAESRQLDLITKLSLGTERISGKGLGHLKDLDLKELDLSGTGITDEGLAEISKLTKLERLALFRTDVSDAGLAHLQKVPTLKRVILARGLAKFTDEGVDDLQKSLPNCKIDQW